MKPRMPNFKVKTNQTLVFFYRMVLEWREHKQEDVDRVVQVDLVDQQDFREYGLYKFWRLGSLRAKTILFQMLVDY